MNPYLDNLKHELNWFANDFAHDQKDELLRKTIKRFCLRFERFNENERLIIDNFNIGYDLLEPNKNIYYLLQVLYKHAKSTNKTDQENDLINAISKAELLSDDYFVDTVLPEVIERIGGKEECQARIANTGACHLDIPKDIMADFIHIHTRLLCTEYLKIYGATDDELKEVIDYLDTFKKFKIVLCISVNEYSVQDKWIS